MENFAASDQNFAAGSWELVESTEFSLRGANFSSVVTKFSCIAPKFSSVAPNFRASDHNFRPPHEIPVRGSTILLARSKSQLAAANPCSTQRNVAPPQQGLLGLLLPKAAQDL